MSHPPLPELPAGGAVLLDALGTLLALEPPAPRLRAALRERLGVDVGEEGAARAMRAEIAYYRAHLAQGRDGAGLTALRWRCAELVRDELGLADAPLADVLAALLDALAFTPYRDVAPALRALRARGLRLVVVSNWDVSLHEALARTGLDALVDAAVASAELGRAKPDPAIFAHALALAGVDARRAVHVGDSLEADVGGARGAGVAAVLVLRDGQPAPPGVPTVRSLAELAQGGPYA
jgi:putative hydrolase of the HAD superfamily